VIDRDDIEKIAKARLKDAKVLADARRYEGAMYLCGYAVELGLKARICRTLEWTGFPSTKNEFKGYSSFKTHDLDVLLHLSGIEKRIKKELLAEWSIVAEWDPESRYNVIGSVSPGKSDSMILSATTLLAKL